jgi:hypothetical protein
MKKTAWGRYACLVVILVICNLITACGLIVIHVISNTYESLAGTKMPAKASGPAFKKIIIVGLTPDNSQRIAFENAFMGQFIEQGVNTGTSCIGLPDAEELLDRQRLVNAIDNGSYDCVLTVELKNIAAGEAGQWLTAWKAVPVHGGDSLYKVLAGGDKEKKAPTDIVRYEVLLWEGNTARQVWAGTTKAIDKFEAVQEVHTAAHSTVKTLISDGLLKATL